MKEDRCIELAKHCVGLDRKNPYTRHGKKWYKPYRNYYDAYLCSIQADENKELKEMSDIVKTVIRGTKTISEYKHTQEMMKKLALELFEIHKSAVENWQNGEIEKIWFDRNGNLCIEYTSGNWWHYNEKGEWW